MTSGSGVVCRAVMSYPLAGRQLTKPHFSPSRQPEWLQATADQLDGAGLDRLAGQSVTCVPRGQHLQ